MTTLAAIQGKSWAVIGYDARVAEALKKYTLPNNASKCFHVGDYIIGVAGDFRAVNILTFSFDPPSAEKMRGVALDRFMQTTFLPSLRACYEAENYAPKEGDGASLLVVVNGTVYEVGEDYSFLRDEKGLYAIGSGGSYALGALYALEDGTRKVGEARERVQAALDVASALDMGTSAESAVLTQHWQSG